MAIIVGVAVVILAAVYLASFGPGLRGEARRFEVADVADAPKPFGYKMAWLAVRTEDPRALMDWLGLGDCKAANWDSGIGTVYDDELSGGHVFVSPAVNGWTFVVGLGLPHPVGTGFVDKLTPLLMRLGAEYPDVQYYFTYPLIDFFAWARVKNGKLQRAFAVNDEGVVWNKGRVTAEERALGLRLFELRGVRERSGDAGGELVLYPTEDHVLQIARAWSLDPTRLDDLLHAGEGCGAVAAVPLAWMAERRRNRAA